MKLTEKSGTLIIRKGVRQGYPLSLILFNISIDQPIKDVQEILLRNEIGIQMSGEPISFLRFTDAIALLANNEYNLETQKNWQDD